MQSRERVDVSGRVKKNERSISMVEEISHVSVKPLAGYGNLKALASLNFRGVVLKGLKLMENDKGLWLGMPSRKKDEQWEDYYFFPDVSVRTLILDRIVERYKIEMGAGAQ